jgi:nucleotide-binding universal stress UspA family protein
MDWKEVKMYKKILFGTCLTDYCSHIFNYALSLAKENDAKLWIFHGLGRLKMDGEELVEAIKKAEAKVADLYVEQMRTQGFTNYAINVSEGDVVSEISKLARNAAIDVLVLGTSTESPMARGESINVGPLGPVASEALLRSPCPVLVVPPTMIPGLAHG